MEVIVAVDTFEGYVGAPGTTDALVSCTRIVAGNVVESAVSATGSSAALVGRVTEVAAFATQG